MKEKTIYILLLPFGIFFLLSFIPQNKYEIENRKQIKEILKKMHFVEGGTFTAGKRTSWEITEKDSTLLASYLPSRQTASSFYINATEVTNFEWWEFYLAMVDELGVDKAIELYLPDTSVWTRDWKYSYNEPMARNYFQHEAFNDYPVLGISWVQAQAYCEWKTQILRSAARNSELVDLTIRLPTQNEWELAAYGSIDSTEQKRFIYPWEGTAIQKNGNYLANIGILLDQNQVWIKGYPDDGGLYTVSVGSYSSNPCGLYDMAGNVAEWVSDTAMIYNYKRENRIYRKTDIDAYIEELEDEEHFEFIKENLLHDRAIVTQGDMRLIKGGSWADGLAYIQIGSREAMDKNYKSSRVGFRIAASYDKKYEKYFPKKYWKPKKKKKRN